MGKQTHQRPTQKAIRNIRTVSRKSLNKKINKHTENSSRIYGAIIINLDNNAPRCGAKLAVPSGKKTTTECITKFLRYNVSFSPHNNAQVFHTSYRNDLVLTRRELTSGKFALDAPQLTATRSNPIQPVCLWSHDLKCLQCWSHDQCVYTVLALGPCAWQNIRGVRGRMTVLWFRLVMTSSTKLQSQERTAKQSFEEETSGMRE